MDQPLGHQILFQTDRLTACRLGPEHVAALLAVYGDRETVRWVDDGEPLTPEDAARWVEVTDGNYAARGYGMAALMLTETHEVVGFCGIVRPGGQAEDELKYALLRSCWGRGLATEAARGMLAHGAERLGLTEIIATVAAENAASLGVLAKVGMEPAGERSHGDGTVTRVLRWTSP
ncbi:GNAT family N-acetyltransferase [Planctomycetota bacterium]|nr:GNAT family N-acetyltransferase [Planctomycetota bacterium]